MENLAHGHCPLPLVMCCTVMPCGDPQWPGLSCSSWLCPLSQRWVQHRALRAEGVGPSPQLLSVARCGPPTRHPQLPASSPGASTRARGLHEAGSSAWRSGKLSISFCLFSGPQSRTVELWEGLIPKIEVLSSWAASVGVRHPTATDTTKQKKM